MRFRVINKSLLPVYTAAILCLYYLLPKPVAMGLEFVLLFFAMSNGSVSNKTRYPIIWYFVFVLLLSVINFLVGIDENSSGYLTTCINCLLFVVILSFSIKTPKDIDSFIVSFASAGAVFCIALIPLIGMAMIGGARLGEAGGAENNSFLSSSISIGYMTVLINICQFRCMTNPDLSRKVRFLFFALFIFSFFCILMSGTRKSLIASLLFISIYVFFASKINFWKLILYGCVFVAILYFIYQLTRQIDVLYIIIGQRIEGLIGFFDPNYADVDDSTLARKQLIDIGWSIFYDNIILGAGIKETQRLLVDASHPHNNYLSCLDFGGIVCFISYYMIYIKSGIGYIKKKYFDQVDICMLGIIAALLLTDYAATTYNIIVFPSFLAIIYIKSRFETYKPIIMR